MSRRSSRGGQRGLRAALPGRGLRLGSWVPDPHAACLFLRAVVERDEPAGLAALAKSGLLPVLFALAPIADVLGQKAYGDGWRALLADAIERPEVFD